MKEIIHLNVRVGGSYQNLQAAWLERSHIFIAWMQQDFELPARDRDNFFIHLFNISYHPGIRIIGQYVTSRTKMAAERGTLFRSDKTRVLGKVDLSRKGSVDEPIRDLIDYINAQDTFYTTSSCSGRLAVFSEVGVKTQNFVFYFLVASSRVTSSTRRTASGC